MLFGIASSIIVSSEACFTGTRTVTEYIFKASLL